MKSFIRKEPLNRFNWRDRHQIVREIDECRRKAIEAENKEHFKFGPFLQAGAHIQLPREILLKIDSNIFYNNDSKKIQMHAVKIPAEEYIEILERNENIYIIKTQNGVQGWIDDEETLRDIELKAWDEESERFATRIYNQYLGEVKHKYSLSDEEISTFPFIAR